jgi:hypothetical protein
MRPDYRPFALAKKKVREQIDCTQPDEAIQR